MSWNQVHSYNVLTIYALQFTGHRCVAMIGTAIGGNPPQANTHNPKYLSSLSCWWFFSSLSKFLNLASKDTRFCSSECSATGTHKLRPSYFLTTLQSFSVLFIFGSFKYVQMCSFSLDSYAKSYYSIKQNWNFNKLIFHFAI